MIIGGGIGSYIIKQFPEKRITDKLLYVVIGVTLFLLSGLFFSYFTERVGMVELEMLISTLVGIQIIRLETKKQKSIHSFKL